MALTDCAILSGYSKDCRSSIGGIRTVYLTELSNKSSITSASGNISAFTLTSGKKFWTFELEQATATGSKGDPKPNPANGTFYVEQTLNFKIPKASATFSYHLKNLAQNDLMAIILDNNGTYWLLGETNGLKMQDGTASMGTALADMNGYDLNFLAQEPDMAKTVASNLIATLLSPA